MEGGGRNDRNENKKMYSITYLRKKFAKLNTNKHGHLC